MQELLLRTKQVLEQGRAVKERLPASRVFELKDAWQRRLHQKPLPPLSPVVAEALDYAAKHGFNVTNSHLAWAGAIKLERVKPSSYHDPQVTPGAEYRPFNVASKPSNVILRVQKEVFRRVLDRTKGVFVYPAMGFDYDCVPAEGKYVDVSPDGPPLPPLRVTARIEYVQRKAEDATPQEIEAAKKKLGSSKNTVLVLKGIQSILSQRELASFVERVSPTHVMAMETPANGYATQAYGLPVITPELEETLKRAGFIEKTGDYFSANERKLLDDIHGLGRDHFAWSAGHFPAVRVRVWEKR
ncbi:MAG: hypothetical protein AB1626_02100 [Candidatus Micrarchaeota archaeon]